MRSVSIQYNLPVLQAKCIKTKLQTHRTSRMTRNSRSRVIYSKRKKRLPLWNHTSKNTLNHRDASNAMSPPNILHRTDLVLTPSVMLFCALVTIDRLPATGLPAHNTTRQIALTSNTRPDYYTRPSATKPGATLRTDVIKQCDVIKLQSGATFAEALKRSKVLFLSTHLDSRIELGLLNPLRTQIVRASNESQLSSTNIVTCNKMKKRIYAKYQFSPKCEQKF